jgi:hypothetical protein
MTINEYESRIVNSIDYSDIMVPMLQLVLERAHKRLEIATDPIEIHRVQGEIQALRYMIELPQHVARGIATKNKREEKDAERIIGRRTEFRPFFR